MLRYNMKQKLGKRQRGARAVKSMEPGFHFVPSLLLGENGFPEGRIFTSLPRRFFGLPQAGHIRGLLIL